MKRGIAIIAALASILIGGQVLAQDMKAMPKILPGLWEHTIIMKSESGLVESAMGQVQEQLASLPPEQRKMMEEMMASQGVGLGSSENSIRVCITEEDVASDDFPQMDDECTQEVVERTGKSIKFKITCTGDPPTSGEAQVAYLGPKAYEGKGFFITVVDGKPQRMDMEQKGKWLSSDCGDVKPAGR